eukprot:TRINITY_DN13151_c0_g1_i2.p1 TRINITY_DN13151_c0_g1~~TRINITY_DN13151_c0_g1_i2.p1  ORF type:complete len:138 (-),score=1.93 TRINITY_DN13151_c0_g1_i2:283-696(-)
MCIRDRYQRRVHGFLNPLPYQLLFFQTYQSIMDQLHIRTIFLLSSHCLGTQRSCEESIRATLLNKTTKSCALTFAPLSRSITTELTSLFQQAICSGDCPAYGEHGSYMVFDVHFELFRVVHEESLNGIWLRVFYGDG